MKKIQTMRADLGRDHLPFETVMGLTEPADLDTLKRLYDSGVTASVNLPFAYTIGWESTLEEKRAQMQRFAEDFVQPMAEYAAGRNL